MDHKHVGSLHAADAEMAIENARDVYTRRMEGVSIWVGGKQVHPCIEP
jgi:ring-1,2-phenylacetyl-CoA epoxidase subunit PaaB